MGWGGLRLRISSTMPNRPMERTAPTEACLGTKGAPEASHDFVGDHEDAVFVAEFADAFEVAVRRNENAVGADDGLEDEGGNGVRAFELHSFFDHGERSFG